MRDSPTLAMAVKIAQAKANGLPVLSLSTPTFPHQPLVLPNKPVDTRLSPPRGDPQCRELMAQRLFHHWEASPEEVVITGGAKASLLCLYAALRTPQSRLVCLTPAWPTYWQLAETLQLPTVLLSRRLSKGWDLETPLWATQIKPSDIVVLSNPCNPTGRVYRPEEIEPLAQACHASGAWLILDESFSETAEASTGYFAPRALPNASTIVINSVSKNFLAQGWRLGAVHAHETVLSVYTQAQTMLVSPPAGVLQSCLSGILANQPPAAQQAALRKQVLNTLQLAGYKCAPGRGSFYLFPHKTGLSHKLVEAQASAQAFALTGSTFGLEDPDYVRLCLLQDSGALEQIIGLLSSF